MAVVQPSDDPLTRAIERSTGDSTENRAALRQAEALARQTSNEIDDWLRREGAKRNPSQVKILLLGQAESGKSTILKNMKLVYAKESFQKERASWPPIIHFNIIRHVATIIHLVEVALDAQDRSRKIRPSADGSEDPQTPSEAFTDEHRVLCLRLKPLLEVEANVTKLLLQSINHRPGQEVCVHTHFAWTKYFHLSRPSRGDALKTEVGRILNGSCGTILQLWHDPVVRHLLHDQAIRLEHEAGFFLDELDRVTALDYEPTDLDVCKARLKTIGVTETPIKVKAALGHTDWLVIDIGGSRTHRASWKPFFDDVNAIVFMAPLSAFNQRLEELPEVNRLEDSLLLWKDLSSSPLLSHAHLIIFLNKIDLLRRKLEQGIKFSSFLETYTGPNECNAVCKHMRKKFLSVYKEAQEKLKEGERASSDRVVRVFATSALDLASTRQIIIQVETSILHQSIASSSIV